MFNKCFKVKVHHFPIITAVWLTASYIITYITAIVQGHVNPLFPYISWTGTTPPESCVFSFLLNVGSALMFLVVFIRYKLLEVTTSLLISRHLNTCGFCLGLLSCLGINLVANFQETNVLVVHMIGAMTAFGTATLYCCIQVWITWKINGSSKSLTIFRVVLCILMIPTFIDMFVFGNLADTQFNGNQILHWEDENGGYSFHLVATFSEWIMALAINGFVFTLTSEFKRIRFEGVVFSKKC
ncbi:hypothetical protein NQ315_010660 [Exocentrus adspersus]|uniref:CWH43-like N-terminal domain-containing protein n=1 Tax=Exocentrus adspersus TaxID=1586481 RepID=A0AAV8W5Y8_9CUCU|nr:hypothetical protein NQ315_010660 [Exocentrus adspersus]